MKGPFPLIRCLRGQVQMTTLRGEPWPSRNKYRGALLSQRDVIVGTVSRPSWWRALPQERRDEVMRRYHPGPISNLESFWWDARRGKTGFALMDRTLLQGIRRSLGDKLPLLIPLGVTVYHPDGIKEECWITEEGDPQASFIPLEGREEARASDQQLFLVKKAFPRPSQVRLALLRRAVMVLFALSVAVLLVLAPWRGVISNRRDFLHAEENRRERLARTAEWEKSFIGREDSPLRSNPPSGLEEPWNFLMDLSRRTSHPLGIEIFTLGKSQFRLRLWGMDFQDLTNSLSADAGITGFEFSEYPPGGDGFHDTGLVSLSLTGGYGGE